MHKCVQVLPKRPVTHFPNPFLSHHHHKHIELLNLRDVSLISNTKPEAAVLPDVPPEGSVAPYRRRGGAPALAASFLLLALLLEQRHVPALVALVGQVLVEGHGGLGLADGRPSGRHVVFADVWHLAVGEAVGL